MSLISKIQALITAANAKTGETDATLTDAVQTLVDGYGQGGTPTGKKLITDTSETDVAAFATAQVSSDTLLAENIKKDVNILGVVGSLEGGGIDALLYTDQIRFYNRYPSANPDIYAPRVDSCGYMFASTSYGQIYPYTTIKLKTDVNVTSLGRFAWADRPSQKSPLTSVTLDFPSLASCTDYTRLVSGHGNLKFVLGTPLDFTKVTGAGYANWVMASGSWTPTDVYCRYAPNTLHINQDISGATFTDDTMVSIANGLQSGAHKLTLHADMKTKCQTIMGTVSQATEGGATYDFFTASASGTVTLENFITQTKGWTIA